jgi:hypothetical protein
MGLIGSQDDMGRHVPDCFRDGLIGVAQFHQKVIGKLVLRMPPFAECVEFAAHAACKQIRDLQMGIRCRLLRRAFVYIEIAMKLRDRRLFHFVRKFGHEYFVLSHFFGIFAYRQPSWECRSSGHMLMLDSPGQQMARQPQQRIMIFAMPRLGTLTTLKLTVADCALIRSASSK